MYDDIENANEEAAIRHRIKVVMKAYRSSKGWSRKEMAGFLHVSEDNYESYEGKADRGVPPSVIARFCKFTDTDLNWVMYGRKATRAGLREQS